MAAAKMSLCCRNLGSIFSIYQCNITFLSNRPIKLLVNKYKLHLPTIAFQSTVSDPGTGTAREAKKKNASKTSSMSFDEMLEQRRSEAQRSILVQVHSDESCSELHSHCSLYGSVKAMYHYTLPGPCHYVLVEFSKESEVSNVLNNSGHSDEYQVLPASSPFLWFRVGKEKATKKIPVSSSEMPLVEKNGNVPPLKDELYNWMLQAQTLSDQMQILHSATRLTELGARLRFLAAHQMERALGGPFPHLRALPFGSTVNGFGKLSCDLDLVLEFHSQEARAGSRLVFHAKSSLANERTQVQRCMEAVADACQLFMPGCSNVKRILQARVPIVRYRQDFVGIDCDVSMTNSSGVHMSEMLYLLGECDRRVRPLVLSVRAWARAVGLTNPAPGRWISNFSLTLLVLFFLQQAPPVLPPLAALVSMAGPADRRVTAEGVNCTFVRDINKLLQHLEKKPRNTRSVAELFLEFFAFYSAFDFGARAINLGTGAAAPKPEHAPLYIANPLEQGLNVSKNVSLEELERIRMEVRNAAWLLESAETPQSAGAGAWGLVALLRAPELLAKGRNVFYIPPQPAERPRLVTVSTLFADRQDDSAETDTVAESPPPPRARSAAKAAASPPRAKRTVQQRKR